MRAHRQQARYRTEEASGAEDEAQTVSIETSEYYFGKINVPYADFYYGEINHVQPEALEDAAAGQYDAEDKVTAAGLREEGIYDSVTSATSQKSQRFEKSYFEQNGDGTDILGPSSVNVAIPKTLYDDVKAAIEAGTECSNPLVELVSSLEEVSEEVPAEYKVINSDGTLSQTIGTTNEAENVTVSFATVSTWGNYKSTLTVLRLNLLIFRVHSLKHLTEKFMVLSIWITYGCAQMRLHLQQKR